MLNSITIGIFPSPRIFAVLFFSSFKPVL